MHVAAYHRQQRGLTAAVLAGDAHLLAAKQVEGGAGEQHPRTPAHRNCGKIQHERRGKMNIRSIVVPRRGTCQPAVYMAVRRAPSCEKRGGPFPHSRLQTAREGQMRARTAANALTLPPHEGTQGPAAAD